MSPASLRPCSSCERFHRLSEPTCPHCGARSTNLGQSARAALIGLAIGSSFACVQEAKYGAPVYNGNGDTSDTSDTADSESDAPEPETE